MEDWRQFWNCHLQVQRLLEEETDCGYLVTCNRGRRSSAANAWSRAAFNGQSYIIQRPAFEWRSATASLCWVVCVLKTIAAGDVLQIVAVGEFFCCSRSSSSNNQMSSFFFIENVYFSLGNVMYGQMNFCVPTMTTNIKGKNMKRK